MAFASWCLCHAFDARRRFDALEQAMLRRRFAADAKSFRQAMLARYISELSPGIRRDIFENRTEA